MTKSNKMSSTRETVYDRCAYVGCYNGKFINGRRLFHFPSETDRRLEMWIERSGNFRLRTWAATSLRKAGLCGDHFDDKCFTNSTRKALRRNVVPRHYTEDRKFRKTNGESTMGNNENNDNNRNSATTEEDEDNSLNCKRLLSISDESMAVVQIQTNGARDESSLQSREFLDDEAKIEAADDRSPSPVVEFIVEELDESLIYDESCKPEDRYSPTHESSVGDSISENEKKIQIENEESCVQQTSPMRLEETKETTGPGQIGLRVNRSDSDVRTYYRSKSHCQLKLELASGESETFTDEEISATVETNPKFRPKSIGCANKRHEKMLLTLRDENKHLRKIMRTLKQKLRRAKARESKYTKTREMLKNVDEFLNIQECTNPVARAMVKLALHKHNALYTKEEKDFAMQLYRHSSTAFVRLRTAGCNFPGIRTVRRWMAEVNGEPGTCDFITATETDDHINRDEMVEDIRGISEGEMVEEVETMGDEIEEAVEDAEDAIDDLVERLEEQIDDAEGHEEYVEELPPDEDDEEDLK